ncbi:MAG: NADH-quinone oxidoreductase subunit J family protein, partial [Endomicrobiales bacterium]
FLFYALAAALLAASVGVVSARNIFHSGLLLGAALLSVAGIYLLLGAEFLAAVQVLVYVGGILTLILFAVMLTHGINDKTVRQASEQKGRAFLASLLVFVVMAFALYATPLPESASPAPAADTARVGAVLFTQAVLPFEVLSVLLLVALIGAVIIARRDDTV